MTRGALAIVTLAIFQTPQAAPAHLSGAVRDAVTGQPVRGSAVALLPDGLRTARMVYTNDAGEFSFEGLPAGAYQVSASHDRYFQAHLGSPTFGEEPVALVLPPGERITNSVMTLLPTSSIAGRVTDEHDRPKPRAKVFLRQRTVVGGIDWLSSPRERSVQTDEDGAYRFERLRPGSYFVGVSWGGAGVPDTSHAYRPIFYPDATRAERATPIGLESGGIREGVDLHLNVVPAHTVSGRATAGGVGLRGASLRLVQSIAHERPSLEPLDFAGTVTTTEGGGFMLRNVAPGWYTLVALWSDPIDHNGLWARVKIEVRETDLADVDVPLQPRSALHGRLALEGVATGSPAFESPHISLVPMTDGYPSGPSVPLAMEGGSFSANGLTPGLYRIQLMFEPRWRVKSVLFGDRDVSKTPFEVTSQESAELRVTLTSQTCGLFGSVITPQAGQLRDPVAVIYTTNPDNWASGIEPRLVQTVPAPGGRFVVDGMDPGDYYVAAVDRVDFLTAEAAAGFPALAGTSFLMQADGHTTSSTYDAVTPTRATLEQWSKIAAKVTVTAGTRAAVVAPLIRVPSSIGVPHSLPQAPISANPSHDRIRPIGASLEGMVLDPAGDPAMGVSVVALLPNLTSGGGFNRVRSARTDRYGHYAIDGLPKGEYIVAIPGWLVGNEARVEGANQTVSRAEVFYPGVAEFGQARLITVSDNEVHGGIDLALRWTPASMVSGDLSCSTGTVLAQALAQVRATPGRLFADDSGDHVDDWQVDHEYRFAGLLSGRYIIEARAVEKPRGDLASENGRMCWGRVEVDVDGQHPVATPLVLRPGAIVAVIFQFEGDRPGEYWHWDADWKPEGRPTTGLPNSAVPKFTVGDAIVWNGLPAGTFRLNPVVRGWRVTSVTRADKPFEGLLTVSLGDEVRDIVVKLTKASR